MHFDQIVMMKKMMKTKMIDDDDDHDENVVVEILVLVNELSQARAFSSLDYLTNENEMMMTRMRMKKMMNSMEIDDVDEVLEID